MSTFYNMYLLMEHPVSVEDAPEGKNVMAAFEAAAHDQGLSPISGGVFRVDSDRLEDVDTAEVAARKAFPDIAILSVAKMLDGFLAQAMDHDSDVESREAVLAAGAGSLEIALAFIHWRNDHKMAGEV